MVDFRWDGTLTISSAVKGFRLGIDEIHSASHVWTCGTMYYIPHLPDLGKQRLPVESAFQFIAPHLDDDRT